MFHWRSYQDLDDNVLHYLWPLIEPFEPSTRNLGWYDWIAHYDDEDEGYSMLSVTNLEVDEREDLHRVADYLSFH